MSPVGLCQTKKQLLMLLMGVLALIVVQLRENSKIAHVQSSLEALWLCIS